MSAITILLPSTATENQRRLSSSECYQPLITWPEVDDEMTGTLQERLRLAKIVLKELNKRPLRRTELEKRTIRQCGTHNKFVTILRYLKQSGYVEKAEPKLRAPYRITERGRKFLEGL
jgi:predicted transcriptional regulator